MSNNLRHIDSKQRFCRGRDTTIQLNFCLVCFSCPGDDRERPAEGAALPRGLVDRGLHHQLPGAVYPAEQTPAARGPVHRLSQARGGQHAAHSTRHVPHDAQPSPASCEFRKANPADLPLILSTFDIAEDFILDPKKRGKMRTSNIPISCDTST